MNESLANKYRPRYLKDLIGQEKTVSYLAYLITKNINKNLIFTGEFGTGKTTSARIYANALLCTNKKENGYDICGECDTCKAFVYGKSEGYTEFDAASQGSVENIKNLLDSFSIPPVYTKKKIWVVDEAHSMSPKAWDALLKTVEEPKPFQVILFCTNYPDKIRPAILSRCQEVSLKLLSIEDSVNLLEQTCISEGYKFNKSALRYLSYLSKGHSRNLLKNLERVGAIKNEVTVDTIRTSGIVDDTKSAYTVWEKVFLHTEHITSVIKTIVEASNGRELYEDLLELFIAIKIRILGRYDEDISRLTYKYTEVEIAKLIKDVNDFIKLSMVDAEEVFKKIDTILLSSQEIGSLNKLNLLFSNIFFSIRKNKGTSQTTTEVAFTNKRRTGKNKIKVDDSTQQLFEQQEIQPIIETKEIQNTPIEDQPIIKEKQQMYLYQLREYGFTKSIETKQILYL